MERRKPRTRSPRGHWLACLAAAVAMLGASETGAVTIPNTLVNGEIADANEVNTNFQVLKAAIDALEATVAGLQTKLGPVTIEDGGTTFRFNGVNVQIVDGSGSPGAPNSPGLGNLILGYNEDSGPPEDRSGSHNLIIGVNHGFSSYAGLVAGRSNRFLCFRERRTPEQGV